MHSVYIWLTYFFFCNIISTCNVIILSLVEWQGSMWIEVSIWMKYPFFCEIVISFVDRYFVGFFFIKKLIQIKIEKYIILYHLQCIPYSCVFSSHVNNWLASVYHAEIFSDRLEFPKLWQQWLGRLHITQVCLPRVEPPLPTKKKPNTILWSKLSDFKIVR